VASVSCIYGLGSPEAYYGMMLFLEKARRSSGRTSLASWLTFLRADGRGFSARERFRVRGDVIEIYPTYDDNAYRVEMFAMRLNHSRRSILCSGRSSALHAAADLSKTHYVMKEETRASAVASIRPNWLVGSGTREARTAGRIAAHPSARDVRPGNDQGHGLLPRPSKLLAPFHRTPSGRAAATLLDYFPRDFSPVHRRVASDRAATARHVSRRPLAQADAGRIWIPHASALDKPPLTFEEFEHRTNQIVYVSATPGPYELTKSAGVVVEQIIRPTGLIDPPVEIRPVKGQIDDLLHMIRDPRGAQRARAGDYADQRNVRRSGRVLQRVGVKCRYMHSEIETLERVKILRDLRKGEFDVLIASIFCAKASTCPKCRWWRFSTPTKKAFLRSAGSLIQTIGRCARNLNGRAILYADRMTDSMKKRSTKPTGGAPSSRLTTKRTGSRPNPLFVRST